MKQLISVLVAAMFAAVSATAIAQDKAAEKKDKTSTTQAEKKPAKSKTTSTKTKKPKAEGTSAKKTEGAPMKDGEKKAK